MRKHLARLSLVMLLILGIASVASAQSGLPGSGWWTSVTFQNVGSAAGQVDFTTYPGDKKVSFSLNAGQNKAFLPGSPFTEIELNLGGGFDGAGVATADQPIAAIEQIGNNPIGTELGIQGGLASAQFNGVSRPSKTIFYPIVKNQWQNKTTFFSIQAAGGDVDYTATITANDGKTYTNSGKIPANNKVLLEPNNFQMPGTDCGTDANTSPCLGSIEVTTTGGTGQLAGAVVETPVRAGQINIEAQATAMLTPDDAGNALFCPIVKNAYTSAQRRHSGISVQNVGTEDAKVSFQVLIEGGGTGTGEATIKPGASQLFMPFIGTITGMPEGSYGAGVVTSTGGKIVAQVNESNFEGTTGQIKSTTNVCYNRGSNIVAFPQVKEAFNGSTGSATVQNIGTKTATVNMAYSCGGQNIALTSKPLDRGASEVFIISTTGGKIPLGTNCAVQASCTDCTIVGLAQETSDNFFPEAAKLGNLDTKNYEGFNLGTLVAP